MLFWSSQLIWGHFEFIYSILRELTVGSLIPEGERNLSYAAGRYRQVIRLKDRNKCREKGRCEIQFYIAGSLQRHQPVRHDDEFRTLQASQTKYNYNLIGFALMMVLLQRIENQSLFLF